MPGSRGRGAVFTPVAAARALASAAARPADRSVCDPAAGDGRLLAAAAGASSQVPQMYAADIDATAWTAATVTDPDLAMARFVCANSLVHGLDSWPDAPPAGFDLVIGNPPFRAQLQSETWLRADERRLLQHRYGDALASYTDTASLFLVAACEMAAPDGRVAFIMPLSFLTARDAAPARRRVLELASLRGLWIPGTRVFPDADVQVCALILDRGAPRRGVLERWRGPEWSPAPGPTLDNDALHDEPTWGHLAADLLDDLPDDEPAVAGTLGEMVTATAGFRDQFYGLAPHVAETARDLGDLGDGLAPMITSGLVDPGRVAWGERSTRIAGTTWHRPAVTAADLGDTGPLARWVHDRRRPKLVVATQTRVLEAAPDPAGEWIPSTPVLAVHAEPPLLWHALAVLLAPPVTVWARRRYTGAALTPTALKLSAAQVLQIPTPVDTARWEAAAGLLADAHDVASGGCPPEAVDAAAAQMTEAYRVDHAVHQWWRARAWPAGAPV